MTHSILDTLKPQHLIEAIGISSKSVDNMAKDLIVNYSSNDRCEWFDAWIEKHNSNYQYPP